ncbi:LexA-binding, inner membrane-associated putative hydrolase [Halogranum gelatinilyticum]|uniref:LexA-binding, inner membrane-associated putative hydrolase n=1 Tax=Halogranum gelatinilyticum TaxID=660521 RepID=A0A1G9QL30_9EURY|nr:metal-dependent hydrolase [Halogranum gelatinilyticum]SDM11551.1 LexA-binding, inner membrane-associated putative hydrolase [Halogranum gelatinilyticum]
MNKKGHVLNAILLSIGLGYVLEPSGDVATFEKIAQISVPIVLGALFPDVDTAFGKHRKTLHNLAVLGIVAAYPLVFNNLHFVWIGVVTHYILDLMGSKRGIALFYPWDKEFALPIGVATSSKYADLVTVIITAFEVAAFAAVHFYVVSLDINVAALAAAFGFGV